MIIVVGANGETKTIIPEQINQSSNNANTIYLIAPFSKNIQVNMSFLVNDVVLPSYLMEQIDSISDTLNTWKLELESPITQYYGVVKYSFRAINTEGIVIATGRGQFKVNQGVDFQLPEQPDNQTYDLILQKLSDIDSKILNGWIESRGIYPYNEKFEYNLGVLVYHNNEFYTSLINNNLGNSLNDNTKWRKSVIKINIENAINVVERINNILITDIFENDGKTVKKAKRDSENNEINLTYQKIQNMVTEWQETPDDNHYPSEKLTKNYIDYKTNKLSNPNLLINGDFRVNQRNFTSVEATSSSDIKNEYTVDRWVFNSTTTRFGKLEVNSNGGLDFTCYSQAISIKNVLEMNDTNKLKGKTLTATIKISNIVGNSPLMISIREKNTWRTFATNRNITSPGTYSITGQIPTYVTNELLVYISFEEAFVNQTTVSIDWVKLEEGEISTPLSPRPYAEELAMCQRYYQVINNNTLFGYSAVSGYILVIIQFPVEMRTKPTLKMLNPVTLYTGGTAYTQTTASTNAYWISTKGISMSLDNFVDNPSGFYAARTVQDAISLDAEIY